MKIIAIIFMVLCLLIDITVIISAIFFGLIIHKPYLLVLNNLIIIGCVIILAAISDIDSPYNYYY
jgi:hypothetical protein